MLTPQLPPPDSKPEAQFSDDLVEKVGELKALRAWMATAKKAADQLRDEILQELGDADKAITDQGTPVVHVERSTKSVPNTKKLQALYPEVWNAVLEESERVTLKIDLE